MAENNYHRLARVGPGYAGVSLDLWGTLLSNNPKTKPCMFEAYRHILGITQVPFEVLDAAYRSADKYTDLINLTTGENYGLRERLTLALRLVSYDPAYRAEESLVEEHLAELQEAQDRIALELPPRLIHPSIPDALLHLRDEGVITAVASNTGSYPASLMRLLLDGPLDLAGCFTHYSFSDEVGAVKPFPLFYKHLLAGMGTEASLTVHIGDNPKADGEGSQAAGMVSVEVHKEDRHRRGIEHMLYALSCLKTGKWHPYLTPHLVKVAKRGSLTPATAPSDPEGQQAASQGATPPVEGQLPEERKEDA